METKDGENVLVRTIFDRRTHSCLEQGTPPSEKITVKPSRAEDISQFVSELGGPSFKDEKETPSPNTTATKFIPIDAIEMLPESAFGKGLEKTPDGIIASQESKSDIVYERTPVIAFGEEGGAAGGEGEDEETPIEDWSCSVLEPRPGILESEWAKKLIEDLTIEDRKQLLELFTITNEAKGYLRFGDWNKVKHSIDKFYMSGRMVSHYPATIKWSEKDGESEARKPPFLKWSFNAVVADQKGFAKAPVAFGAILRCHIVRDKKGMDRNIFPTYYFHVDDNGHGNGKLLLLTARKRKKSATSNYIISLDPADLSRAGPSYIGKLRSNILGTEFTIYDSGNAPKNAHPGSLGAVNHREELGVVSYESNMFGLKGPRKMKVIIPAMLDKIECWKCRPDNAEESIVELLKKSLPVPTLIELENKVGIWDSKTKSYVLDFKGRVTQPSIKNFQIIHRDRADFVILQFGRIDDDNFTMDIRFPISPIQAFAIALTSFASKLACE